MHINVIIPAYNVAPYVGDAIRSVIGQTETDWTMVVVDDGSTDGTERIVRDFNEPRLKLVRQANAGVSAARNRGLGCCHGDVVMFLDADDWLAPTALSRLRTTLDTAPNAVAAVGPFVRVAADGRLRRPMPPLGGDVLEALLVGNRFLNGGHLLIRRWAIRQAGLFNETLSFGEDWEYWIRLALVGPFAAVPSPSPVLYARERAMGAWNAHVADPAAYVPCLDAIFGNPALRDRYDWASLQGRRMPAEAEKAWTIGRALLQRRQFQQAWPWLCQGVSELPTARRVALATVACAFAVLPQGWIGATGLIDPDQRECEQDAP